MLLLPRLQAVMKTVIKPQQHARAQKDYKIKQNWHYIDICVYLMHLCFTKYYFKVTLQLRFFRIVCNLTENMESTCFMIYISSSLSWKIFDNTYFYFPRRARAFLFYSSKNNIVTRDYVHDPKHLRLVAGTQERISNPTPETTKLGEV